jgi:trans-aconitate methyltransferase
MHEAPAVPPGVDTSVPTAARIYDYMLRGHNYFDADERACQKLLAAVPYAQDVAAANRGFHQRSAKWIAEHGIRQFIDIGSGLPTVGNTHEVVQKVAPGAHVVYVDKDPMVIRHSEMILDGTSPVSVICADLREPDTILKHPDLHRMIDFSQPAALCMTAVLQFVSDTDDPWSLLSRYVDVLAPGSYLSLSHLTDDYQAPVAAEGFRAVFDSATDHMYFRSKAKVTRFFEGLDLVVPYEGAPKPAVTFAGYWGCEDVELADSDGSRWLYCGVAKKP